MLLFTTNTYLSFHILPPCESSISLHKKLICEHYVSYIIVTFCAIVSIHNHILFIAQLSKNLNIMLKFGYINGITGIN